MGNTPDARPQERLLMELSGDRTPRRSVRYLSVTSPPSGFTILPGGLVDKTGDATARTPCSHASTNKGALVPRVIPRSRGVRARFREFDEIPLWTALVCASRRTHDELASYEPSWHPLRALPAPATHVLPPSCPSRAGGLTAVDTGRSALSRAEMLCGRHRSNKRKNVHEIILKHFFWSCACWGTTRASHSPAHMPRSPPSPAQATIHPRLGTPDWGRAARRCLRSQRRRPRWGQAPLRTTTTVSVASLAMEQHRARVPCSRGRDRSGLQVLSGDFSRQCVCLAPRGRSPCPGR